MRADKVPGTQGYEEVSEEFVRVSQSLEFHDINREFLECLPKAPSRILDIGAGAGQNAAALAELGYSVVAVEPLTEFLSAAGSTYKRLKIDWIKDSLPLLVKLDDSYGQFDFILVDGVWHHLDENERNLGIERISHLLKRDGICALSLRNGPAGAGKRVFETNSRETVKEASRYGLKGIILSENQPSVMKHKPGVTWSRVVLKK